VNAVSWCAPTVPKNLLLSMSLISGRPSRQELRASRHQRE
jgi:hypothetical protein